MNRMKMWVAVVVLILSSVAMAESPKRVGVIGLDTSHAPAFARMLNAEDAPESLAGFRVVAAYPIGSADIESSVSRRPKYTKQFREMGIEIVDTIPALLDQVDVVLLTSNDGRVRLKQILPVLKAGKPVFADKPVAASLADAVAIFMLADKYNVPIFSSSSLRYTKAAQAIRAGVHGRVLGADTYSPAKIQADHPDLFWYMIHGVEPLYTVLGTGCETVTRIHTEGSDVVVGRWPGGRIGTVRGMRSMQPGYGGTVFTSKGTLTLGKFEGYQPLAVEIVRLFRTGEPPVSAQETLEIYAFMEAADESKRRGGLPVSIAEVMEKATAEAMKRLAELNESP